MNLLPFIFIGLAIILYIFNYRPSISKNSVEEDQLFHENPPLEPTYTPPTLKQSTITLADPKEDSISSSNISSSDISSSDISSSDISKGTGDISFFSGTDLHPLIQGVIVKELIAPPVSLRQ